VKSASRRSLLAAIVSLVSGAGEGASAAGRKKPSGDGKWAQHYGEFEPEEISGDGFVKTPSGLSYKEVEIGTGAQPQSGNTVTTHYSGFLLDGGVPFDSSYERRSPLSFKVGVGQVIKGWDEALLGMKIGGRRLLVIPPELGYGAKGAGGGLIPGGATLVFYVELLVLSP